MKPLVLVALLCLTGPVGALSTNHSTNNTNVLTIGFLLDVGKWVTFPSLELAVDIINSQRILPNDYMLNFTLKNARADGNNVAQIIQWQEEGVAAVIGPGSRCMVEAAAAAAFNIPIISYGCTESETSNKQGFPTFARTNPSGEKLSKYIIALLNHYKWHEFVLIIDEKDSYKGTEDSLVRMTRKSKTIQVTSVEYIPENYSAFDLHVIKGIMERNVLKTRVFVFIGSPLAQIQFARQMYDHGYTKNDGYVIISVDDEIYDKSISHQYLLLPQEYSIMSEEGKYDKKVVNSRVVDPFKAVIKVTPEAYESPSYVSFIDKMKKSMPFGEFVQIPVFATYIYDAVMVYAHAVKKVLDQGGDPRNGTAILQKIQSSSYTSIRGSTHKIDEHGDSEGTYTILALQKNPNIYTNQFHPIGKFEFNAESEYVYSSFDLEEPEWHIKMEVTDDENILNARFFPFVVVVVALSSVLIATLATSLTCIYCCRIGKKEMMKDQIYQPMIE